MARTRRTTIAILFLVSAVAAAGAPAQAGSAASCPTAFRISPGVSLGAGGQLFGVTSLSPTDVWAVGDYVTEGTETAALTEHWDGSAWTAIPAPNPGEENILNAADAQGSNDVWAVGVAGNDVEGDHSLTLHWDGLSWTVTKNNGLAGLNGVAAVDHLHAWAVGELLTILRWDGHRWTRVQNPALGDGDFHAVSAAAGDDVWFAGASPFGGVADQALLEHWDGSSVSVVDGASIVADSSELLGIDARSSNDVWAVGDLTVGGVTSGLVEHFDGTGWSVVPVPSPGTDATVLSAVVAIAANDVIVVGSATTAGVQHPLVERWNGTAWSVVPVQPVAGASTVSFAGVAMGSPGDAWAVGATSTAQGLTAPLIEHTARACATS